MSFKVILLCAILFVVECSRYTGYRKRAKSLCKGECVKSALECFKKNLSKTGCHGNKFCCPTPKNITNLKNMNKGGGCKQTSKCKSAGGRCLATNKTCLGTVKDNACQKNDNCKCCIQKPGKRVR
ncbi:unnamed protein product, partial [Meganyctiphanes norvegica]